MIGHVTTKQVCEFCDGFCDSTAGDPGEWPLFFPHPDGTGLTRAHHVRCVVERLFPKEQG